MISTVSRGAAAPKPLYEVCGASTEEPVEEYQRRYIRDASELSEAEHKDPFRYIENIFNDFEPDSSLLVFGSGHSLNCNTFLRHCDKISSVVAVDFVREASRGLLPEIGFYSTDILEKPLSGVYDYVFSSHTLEHFNAYDLIHVVLPRLLAVARKACIIAVPYGTCWSDEPSHRVRFYLDDEIAYKAKKHMFLLDDQEIVFWFGGEAS